MNFITNIMISITIIEKRYYKVVLREKPRATGKSNFFCCIV